MGFACIGRRNQQTPPMTRATDQSIEQMPGWWWLLHTKARHEKALAWDLRECGLDYFRPLVRTPRSYRGRRVEVDLPLFAGYMFFSAVRDEDRYRVLDTNRVAGVIEVVNQDRLRSELEQVRRAVNSPHRVSLFPGIKSGRRCRIKSGSLKGIEGVVIRRASTGKVFLDIATLGQSAEVEIDVTLVEPLN